MLARKQSYERLFHWNDCVEADDVAVGTFVLGFLLTMISVDVAKLMCARPRPTFIEACLPDWSRCTADASKLQLSSVNVCRQPDHYVLLEAQ